VSRGLAGPDLPVWMGRAVIQWKAYQQGRLRGRDEKRSEKLPLWFAFKIGAEEKPLKRLGESRWAFRPPGFNRVLLRAKERE
jgi:hypothetical protein